eukprot:sb/3467835/
MMLLLFLLPLSVASSYTARTLGDDLSLWREPSPAHLSPVLSSTYLSSRSLILPFSPSLSNVTVTSQGFLYLGPYEENPHREGVVLIAPLMANYIPNPKYPQQIFLETTGTALYVTWRGMTLSGISPRLTYTFQAQLHSDGSVVLLYKQIPVGLEELRVDDHPIPVMCGVSLVTRGGEVFNFRPDKSVIRSGVTVLVGEETPPTAQPTKPESHSKDGKEELSVEDEMKMKEDERKKILVMMLSVVCCALFLLVILAGITLRFAGRNEPQLEEMEMQKSGVEHV